MGNPFDIVYDCVELVGAAGRRVTINRLVRVLGVAGMHSEKVRWAVKMWVDLEAMQMDGDYVVLSRGRIPAEAPVQS